MHNTDSNIKIQLTSMPAVLISYLIIKMTGGVVHQVPNCAEKYRHMFDLHIACLAILLKDMPCLDQNFIISLDVK